MESAARDPSRPNGHHHERIGDHSEPEGGAVTHGAPRIGEAGFPKTDWAIGLGSRGYVVPESSTHSGR